MALKCLVADPTMAICGGYTRDIPHLQAPPAARYSLGSANGLGRCACQGRLLRDACLGRFASLGFEPPEQRTFGISHNRLVRR
jgi:hypothetical protein